MASCPFQILGTRIARRIGRDREFNRLLSQVERNHLSVVGPKYIGKSVLLLALAEHFQAGNCTFRSSLYWDLKHHTPNDDSQFFSQFASRLVVPVRSVNQEYAAELQGEGVDPLKSIKFVLELLNEEHKAILVCLDGCDNLLLGSAVTRNLWDNLRALAEMDSLRFVTGSRRRLRDLCHSPESKTSDFWNIFANPFGLAAMTESDVQEFAGAFAADGVGIGPGALRELFNWSGGIPVILASHCHSLWEIALETKELTKESVDRVGAELHLAQQDALIEIWQDCTEEQRALFARVQQEEVTDTEPRNATLISSLEARGFLRSDGRKVQIASRVLGNFVAQGAGGRSNTLATLFGTNEGFVANAKGLLQLRFASLPSGDEELLSYLRNAIENSGDPNVLIRMVRGLVERSFRLIWDKAIPNRQIPTEWSTEWKQPDRDGNQPPNNPPEGSVPGRLGRQCQLLNLMTDPRRTKRTTVRRSTYVLLEGLQTVGDFGQHLEGEPVPHGFGVAVCLSALQTVEQVTVDLE